MVQKPSQHLRKVHWRAHNMHWVNLIYHQVLSGIPLRYQMCQATPMYVFLSFFHILHADFIHPEDTFCIFYWYQLIFHWLGMDTTTTTVPWCAPSWSRMDSPSSTTASCLPHLNTTFTFYILCDVGLPIVSLPINNNHMSTSSDEEASALSHSSQGHNKDIENNSDQMGRHIINPWPRVVSMNPVAHSRWINKGKGKETATTNPSVVHPENSGG